jgi:outer membrane lipoprotein-sorting protein
MTHHIASRLGATVLAAVAASALARAEGPNPAAAIRMADEVMYPPSFSMTVTIATERPGQVPSSMEMEVSHKAGRGSFIELLAPSRSKGTRFLQTGSALWMYSPKAGSRTPIRLSPRESFQGSAFSNNDVGDSSWANDYDASLAGSGLVDSHDFGKIEAWIVTGKALRRDVPYGEIRIYMKKEDLLPLRIEYFAKSGLPLKTMDLSDYAKTAGRLRPRRLVMTTADGTGERSVVVLDDLREREDLPDAMFNQSWLTR